MPALYSWPAHRELCNPLALLPDGSLLLLQLPLLLPQLGLQADRGRYVALCCCGGTHCGACGGRQQQLLALAQQPATHWQRNRHTVACPTLLTIHSPDAVARWGQPTSRVRVRPFTSLTILAGSSPFRQASSSCRQGRDRTTT